MAYPFLFLKQTHLWNLPEGEVASCTMGWLADGSWVLSPAMADAFGTRGVALWTAIKDRYHGLVKYKGSRIAQYNTAGVTLHTYERGVTPIDGTGTGDNLPTEVAVCCSLYTAQAGRRYRGRIFLPNVVSGQMTAYGRLATAAATDFAAGVAGYLNGFTADTVPFTSCVVSTTGQLLTPITQVSVGDIFDVQRRRRDALTEVRQTATVT
jgi:hypothetical protein